MKRRCGRHLTLCIYRRRTVWKKLHLTSTNRFLFYFEKHRNNHCFSICWGTTDTMPAYFVYTIKRDLCIWTWSGSCFYRKQWSVEWCKESSRPFGKQNVKIHIYEGANHSLETKSVRDNLDILKDVMEKTSRYMEESKIWKDINWAVLGTGVYRKWDGRRIKRRMERNIYAVGNRTYEKAVALVKSMASVKYMQITMRCLQIRKWMLSISQLLIIHIRNSWDRQLRMANIFW